MDDASKAATVGAVSDSKDTSTSSTRSGPSQRAARESLLSSEALSPDGPHREIRPQGPHQAQAAHRPTRADRQPEDSNGGEAGAPEQAVVDASGQEASAGDQPPVDSPSPGGIVDGCSVDGGSVDEGSVEPPQPSPAIPELPSDESIELPRELVARIRDVVAERSRVESLIQAAAAGRSEVKDEIYRKVQADYESQLQAVQHAYEPLRREAVEILIQLRHDEAELSSSLERVEDELAELRFRCRVGEFGEDELARAERSRLAEVASCETRLERLRATFDLAASLLGEDAGGSSAVAASQDADETKAPEPEARSGFEIDEAPTASMKRAPESPAEVSIDTDRTERIDIKSGAIEIPGSESTTRYPTPSPAAVHTPETTSSSRPLSDSRPQPSTSTPATPSSGTPPGTGSSNSLPGAERPSAESAPSKEIPTVTGGVPSLVMMNSAGEEIYPITAAGLTIGRSKTNHVVLAEPGVSRKHAIIRWQDGELVIEDRSSGGGVVVNGEFVERAPLAHGDVVQIVGFSLRVRA